MTGSHKDAPLEKKRIGGVTYGLVVIDEQKNSECGIDPAALAAGSHIKIWVKCTNCEESFLRERRALFLGHSCPKHKYIEGILHKCCNRCNVFKPTTQFSKNCRLSLGLQNSCNECYHNNFRKKYESLDKYVHVLIRNVASNSKRKNLKFDLTEEFLLGLWELQDGLCYYTRMPISWRDPAKLRAAHLDRISPSKGYTRGNVVWASRAANLMKNVSPVNEFIDFLDRLHYFRHHYKPVRAEHKLIHPDAKTPTQAKYTDAGHDVYSIEDVTISPGTTLNVRTGVILSVPYGHYMTVEGRSSLFKSGIIPARGIIDSTYTGEFIVALTNQSKEPYHIKVGDRIAQFILHRCERIDIVAVDKFSPEYDIRGTDGFGSTGK